MKNPNYESYETIGPALPHRPAVRDAPALALKILDRIYEAEPDCKESKRHFYIYFV